MRVFKTPFVWEHPWDAHQMPDESETKQALRIKVWHSGDAPSQGTQTIFSKQRDNLGFGNSRVFLSKTGPLRGIATFAKFGKVTGDKMEGLGARIRHLQPPGDYHGVGVPPIVKTQQVAATTTGKRDDQGVTGELRLPFHEQKPTDVLVAGSTERTYINSKFSTIPEQVNMTFCGGQEKLAQLLRKLDAQLSLNFGESTCGLTFSTFARPKSNASTHAFPRIGGKRSIRSIHRFPFFCTRWPSARRRRACSSQPPGYLGLSS